MAAEPLPFADLLHVAIAQSLRVRREPCLYRFLAHRALGLLERDALFLGVGFLRLVLDRYACRFLLDDRRRRRGLGSRRAAGSSQQRGYCQSHQFASIAYVYEVS